MNNNTWLTATHIAGVENTEADKESRLFNDRTEWNLKREIFAQITTHWGTPEIDLFATRLNTQLPKFVSWKPDPASCFVDAFTISWKSLYFYAFPPFCQIQRCLQKIFVGTSTSGNHDPTCLAYSSLVATTAKNVNCNPISLAKAGGPTFTITLSSNTTPLKEEIDYAGMSPVWQSIQDRGISEAAAKLIIASWRDRTKKQYSTYITKWQKFCNQRQISHIQPSVVSVLDFLTLLYQQGLTYSVINTARSTLSSYITLENGTCVGKHPLLSRLMKGIFQENPQDLSTQKFGMCPLLLHTFSLYPLDKYCPGRNLH